MADNTLHTRKIYQGKVVHLAVKTIALPDGTTAEREIIDHDGATAVVALDDEQNVFLVRQYRVGADQHLYEIPAGILNPGEPPNVSAVRELREEIGYQPGTLEPVGGFYVSPGYSTEYIHIFYAHDLTPAPLEQDADEFIEVTRVPLAKALAMIEQGEIIDSKTIIGLLRVARHLNL